MDRYHGLDSMRAAMMLLGIYLHVVVGYSGDGNWPYIDPHPTPVLNFSLGLIHAFRMPAFFVMAGFFGALLWTRRGARGFVVNRAQRVLAPFALFWLLIFPPLIVLLVPALTWEEAIKRLHPGHLWFLEYLLLLYLIGMAWAGWIGKADAAFRRVLQGWYGPLVWAAVSWPALAVMRGNLKDCDGFVPELPILAAYVPPFLFGWLLYRNRDLLRVFGEWVWWYGAAAAAAFWIYRSVPGRTMPLPKATANVVFCWLAIFFCTGLFLRYFDRPSAWRRYLSDASYWMYIMHLPVVVGLQVVLREVPLPALAKIPIVLAAAVAVLLGSYDLLVRPTWVGALLNGRRFSRFRVFRIEYGRAAATD
jgi:fucose 4-O-acetylase-like acetyltransferase